MSAEGISIQQAGTPAAQGGFCRQDAVIDATSTDYLSGIAYNAGIKPATFFADNQQQLSSLDAPITGRQFLLCDVPLERRPPERRPSAPDPLPVPAVTVPLLIMTASPSSYDGRDSLYSDGVLRVSPPSIDQGRDCSTCVAFSITAAAQTAVAAAMLVDVSSVPAYSIHSLFFCGPTEVAHGACSVADKYYTYGVKFIPSKKPAASLLRLTKPAAAANSTKQEQCYMYKEVQHMGSRWGYNRGSRQYPRPRPTRFSVYNTATSRYEPVTEDSQYYYYRIVVKLIPTGNDRWDPIPDGNAALRMGVTIGNIVDNSTLIKVGTWDSFTIITKQISTKNDEVTYLAQLGMELGPESNDAIFIAAMYGTQDNFTKAMDHESAITGGTKQFKGATGDVVHSGTGFFAQDHAYTAEVYVPKFKPF
eukprot:gene4009-4260_t